MLYRSKGVAYSNIIVITSNDFRLEIHMMGSIFIVNTIIALHL